MSVNDKPAQRVQIVETIATPLTPEQRKFNTLVKKIELARAELLAWREQRVVFGPAHQQRIGPLRAELLQIQLEVAQRLDAMLTGAPTMPPAVKPPGKGWSRVEKSVMRRFVCDLAGDILEGAPLDEAQEQWLTEVHDRHAETDFASEKRESAEVMKTLFEHAGGVDFGDQVFDTEDDVVRAMHAKLDEQMQARRAEHEARAAKRKPTAAQKRRQQEQADASQSLREVYRKLASALHPDRADDDADAARRTALMQRANQAYEKQDLLALFALQLEVEQVNTEQLAQGSAQKARQYNRLLDEQLKSLQIELETERAHFCMDFGLDPHATHRPDKLGASLEREVRRMRQALMQASQDLLQLADAARAKRWIAQVKRNQELDDDGLFGLFGLRDAPCF
jgi:hypothetical protein